MLRDVVDLLSHILAAAHTIHDPNQHERSGFTTRYRAGRALRRQLDVVDSAGSHLCGIAQGGSVLLISKSVGICWMQRGSPNWLSTAVVRGVGIRRWRAGGIADVIVTCGLLVLYA